MTFERSRDYALIGAIMRHPKLWQADDFTPPRDAFEPRQDEAIWYVLVRDGDEMLGLFAIAPQNGICWEVHTRLLPTSWGKRAGIAGKEFIAWVWGNTPCKRLVTSVPADNRGAIKYAERAGMTRYGVNAASWEKGGELLDQVLLGISQ